jgi:hypothetical protein
LLANEGTGRFSCTGGPALCDKANLIHNWLSDLWFALEVSDGVIDRTAFLPVEIEGMQPAFGRQIAALSPDTPLSAQRVDITLSDGLAGSGGRHDGGSGACGRSDTVISVPSNTRGWLIVGVTDMRRSINTLAVQAEKGF